jgi:hypothetical protein
MQFGMSNQNAASHNMNPPLSNQMATMAQAMSNQQMFPNSQHSLRRQLAVANQISNQLLHSTPTPSTMPSPAPNQIMSSPTQNQPMPSPAHNPQNSARRRSNDMSNTVPTNPNCENLAKLHRLHLLTRSQWT